MSGLTTAESQALKTWAYQVTQGAKQMEIAMTQLSEAYGWLQNYPVGAFIVVMDHVADSVMLTQGGMLYRDDLWHDIRWQRMSPGTGKLWLQVAPYKDRWGHGPRVALANPDRSGPLDSVGQ